MKKIILICVATLFVSACGAGTTTIIDAYNGPQMNLETASIVSADTMVDVPDELQKFFKEAMDEQFFEKGLFTRGTGLKVEYTFTQFEAGNRFSRYMLGGIGNAGEASLTVKVEFFDSDGNKLSAINVGGKIGSGMFGGSVKEAMTKAAKEAAEYGVVSFN